MSNYKYLDDNGLIYYHSKIKAMLNNKVDKESGKGLSTNDYTTTEKNKLSGIATGAEVNQNAFSNVKVGSSTVAADAKTDTLELAAGTGITLTPDTTNDKVTIACSASIPTKTSDLTNDSGFVTNTNYATSSTGGVIKLGDDMFIQGGTLKIYVHNGADIWNTNTVDQNTFVGAGSLRNAINYHLDTSIGSSSTDTHYPSSKCVYDAINDAISGISGISYEIVQALPATGSAGVIYLISNSGTAPNVYDEYIWVSNAFEKIGTTAVDLSGYVQASEMVAITNAEIDTIVA